MKGQLSAEMLIILAIILGIVFIAFTQMTKSAKDVSLAVDEKTEKLINMSNFNPSDVRCKIDSDCSPYGWSCDTYSGYCKD